MFRRWSWPESAKDKLAECLAKGENRFWVTKEEAVEIFNRKTMRPNGFDLDFQRFAFGVTDKVIPLNEQALSIWNSRHGDKLTLHPNGIPERDIPNMWDIYIQYQTDKDNKMKITPRKGYVLVSNQDIVEEKKAGSLIIAGEDNKKTYLRVESDGELFKTGDCVFAHPYKTKMQIDENLYIVAEEDIIASFTM